MTTAVKDKIRKAADILLEAKEDIFNSGDSVMANQVLAKARDLEKIAGLAHKP